MSRRQGEPERIPVPQGERGILWAWSGQPSQLPPPAVGIMALINHKRLGYSLSDQNGLAGVCRGWAVGQSRCLIIRHDTENIC